MNERCFRSVQPSRKGRSSKHAHYHTCTVSIINPRRILMNVTLSLTGLMSLYYLYQVLLLH
jgi:hypothetical protein